MIAFKRMLMVIPAAALITLLLLLIMAMLITRNEDDTLIVKRTILPNVFMPNVEIVTRRLIDKPKKPTVTSEPEQPNAPQQVANYSASDISVAVVAPSQINAAMNLSIGVGLQASDGEYLPIVKVAPEYPSTAARRGIEGYVILEYTVTRQGTTKDIRVIDSKPNNVFNRAATRSAKRYKYKPRMNDGKAIEVAGVRTKIIFRMEK